MQVSRISTVTPKRVSKQQFERNKNNTNNKYNNINPQTQSFKGGALDGFSLWIADLIENGGLFVSFTLQDMLGTNIPRPIVGLFRNGKENKGEKNLKFAAKELVREMLTGPSMFLIPMGMLAVGKKPLGKTVNTPANFINDFGKIHAANPVNEVGKAITKQEFFKNTFTEILKNANLDADTVTLKAKTYAEKLSNSTDKKQLSETIANLSDDFIAAVKGHADDVAFTDFTVAKLSEKSVAPFKETVSHMMSYADDVVVKAAKQTDTSKLSEYVKKLADKKVLSRAGMNIAMYAAVLGFLKIIPKLYNKAEGQENAGLKGLMKEETLNDKSLEQNQTKNNATPSFGSSIPKQAVIDTLTGNGKGTVGKAFGKLAQWMEFEGYNVSFPQLLGIMGFGILIPRLSQAKDKYDREEIARRDLVTCVTMCFAEKWLRKGFSKANENSSGFVLVDKGKNFKQQGLAKRLFDYIRPIKGVKVLSTDQIVSKYSGIDKYNGGINGFCNFIDSQGGNLSKVFSLTEEAKQLAEKIVGKSISGLDNETIKESIAKNIDSDDVKNLTNLFTNKDNAWVKQAKTLNARFTALSVCLLVPAFLGVALPLLNSRATKKRIKEEQAAKVAAQQNLLTNTTTPNFFMQDQKANKVFGEIANFKK